MSPSLPLYPSLEQLKKRAKDLRKAHREGASDAARRLRAHVHGFGEKDDEDILTSDLALRDAQHTIAREHGFPGWQQLLEEVAEVEDRPEPRQLIVDTVEYDDDDLVPVQVLRVEEKRRTRAGMFLLGDPDRRTFWISVGEPECMILHMALRRRDTPRPLMHGLFDACLEQLKCSVKSVVIHALREETFHAHVHLETESGPVCLDARPSDGLILAARRRIEVYATESLMSQIGRPIAEANDVNSGQVEAK